MKDEFDVLFGKNDSDIDHIAENYKAASDKDKEKIYNIAKRKYNIMKAEEVKDVPDDYIKEAEGVERYSRPVWHRWVSMSAASLILVGAVSGGVLLAGLHKTRTVDDQQHSTELSTQVTTFDAKKHTDQYDMDDHMDELLTSWVKIQKAQFGEDSAENDELIYEMESNIIAPEEYIYTYTYHKVTEDGAETFADLDKMLSATYSEYVYEQLIGGDVSKYESGTRFGEETEEGKRLRHFIKYGDSAYARWWPDYNFIDMCDFENYDLVSSDFTDSTDEFDYKSSAFCEWYSGKVYALKFTTAEFYEAFEEKGEDFIGIFDAEYDDMMLCRRVYQAKDGDETVNADFLLVEQDGNWKIANFVIKSDNTEIETPSEPVTTTFVSTDDTVVTSGLQLHEMTIYKTNEEAAKAVEAIEEKSKNGQYKFEKLDTDKYINNMLSGEGDINTLENKGYIYHMLWNSYRYFDTAEVEYKNVNNDLNIENDISVSVDNREKYMHFERESNSGNKDAYYQNGNAVYEIDNTAKTYYKYEINDAEIEGYENYIPDNLRVIYVESENGLSNYHVFFKNYFNSFASECFYCDGTIFNNFDDWNFTYVDQYLGRLCVGIDLGDKEGEYTHFEIDLHTGIILKRINYDASGEERAFLEVKSIKIDEPIEKKMFDINEFTERATH